MHVKKVSIALLALALAGCGKQPMTPADAAALMNANASGIADEAALNKIYQWSYYAKPDPMVTGGVNHFASITSKNTVDFGFPYNGSQNAMLVIRKMAGESSSNYDAMIIIDRGQLLGGDQGNIEAKLDDAAPVSFDADTPSDNSTTSLFFDNGVKVNMTRAPDGHAIFSDSLPLQQFIAEMQKAKTLRVQVTAYQNGNPTFVFDVSGFSLTKLNATSPSTRGGTSGAP